MIGRKHLLITLLYTAIIFLLLPATALANSAEPPALIIVVNNAPGDLSIQAEAGDKLIPASVKANAWETYYVFYYFDPGKNMPSVLHVNTGEESFTIELSAPLHTYDNTYTLDIAAKTLSEGTLPYRSFMLIALRVVITLLIEGTLFYVFGFREKSSWAAFLIINLITQGLLNWALSTGPLISPYRIFTLVLLEILVLLVEIPAVIIAVKEHKKGRRALFALTANIASLILGGFMITLLPV